MSTIKANTLQDRVSTKSVSLERAISSVAKAWVLFDGYSTTPAIKANFGISSLADVGVGAFNLNLAAPFTSTSVCCPSGQSYSVPMTNISYMGTASQLYWRSLNASGAAIDPGSFCSVPMHGDLA